VRDTSGGALPGATVTILNQDTGFTRTAPSDSSGEYTFPLVPTGNYTVTGELSGFKKYSLANSPPGRRPEGPRGPQARRGPALGIGHDPGGNAADPDQQLELGTTFQNEQIEALPLNGRNFVSLTRTIPGILRPPPGANIDGAGSLAWRAGSGFSANGQRPRDNNYLLDGVDNNETWLQTVVIFPSVDALDEFKMQTSTYSAEFGKSLGGVVNIQIKSGANAVHGSAFEFLRNDAFDANNFFNNRAGRAKPDFKQHQFGATLGGPILKDRTFFFVDYQGLRINQGQTYVSTVPTAKMRAGDLSEINRPIFDPLNPGNAFAGNIIPVEPDRSRGAQHPDPALSGGELGGHALRDRTDHQQLRDQPRADAAGQPVRRQARPQRLRQQPGLRALQLPEDAPQSPATLEHGDAGVTFGAG
jgi:hypothetical protein